MVKKLTDKEMEIYLQKYLFADENGTYTEYIDAVSKELDPEMYQSIFTPEQKEYHAKVMEKHNLSDSAKSAEAKKKKVKEAQDIIQRNENLDWDDVKKSINQKPKLVQVCKINNGATNKRTKEEQEEIDNFDWDKYIQEQARLRAAKPKKNYY